MATTSKHALWLLRRPGRVALGVAILWAGLGVSGLAAPATDPAVVAAQKRQDAVASFAIEYKQTDVVSPGAMSDTSASLTSAPKEPVPSRELTLTSVNRLVVDGGKVRFENNHPIFQLPQGEVVEKGIVYLFDGTLSNQFFPKGLGTSSNPHNDVPQGVIKSHPIPAGIRLYETAPIFCDFRGLIPTMAAWAYSDFKASTVALSVGGTSCLEYTKQISAELVVSCWLDPAQDYLMRRVRIQRKDKLECQLDIEYRLNDQSFWVPKTWKFNQFGPRGDVRRSQTFEVLQVRVNESEPASQFEIQYPPGAEVNDQRTDKWYRIQPDGTMREFSRTTGEESSNSIVQPGAPWYRQHQWLLGSFAIVIVLSAFFAFFHLRKRRNLQR
jgi:hypothetical protein